VKLSLSVELFADAAHRNNRFTRWASGREDDTVFGSLGNAFDISWKGLMAVAYPPQVGLVLDKLTDKLHSDLRTSLPTRIVLVLEEGKVLDMVRKWEQTSILCTFPAGHFPTISPSSFRQPYIEHVKLRQRTAVAVLIVQNREATDRYPVDTKALEEALTRWRCAQKVTCKIEPLKSLSLAMESLSRTWTSPGLLVCGNDGKLNWFDGPPAVTKVVALAPHTDSKTQAVLDKLFNFDRYIGTLGLIPSGISSLISKAVNPSNSKAGRLVEKAHISKLSHVIFSSAFGMWMERKRREIAWKSRDKVCKKKNSASRTRGKQIENKDGKAQLGVRRSARILERKIRAEESAHDHRVVQVGNCDDNRNQLTRSPPRSLAPPISVWHGIPLVAHSATQLASGQSQPDSPLAGSNESCRSS
jgi:hypothetical protein